MKETIMKRLYGFSAFITTFLSIMLIACSGDGGDTDDIASKAAISECGGFNAVQAKTIDDEQALGALECGDETLEWQYDVDTDQVKLLNNFIWLNCCGEHSITAAFKEDEGRYEIKEVDAPENGDMRCDCMCIFDFSVDFPAYGADTINLVLIRYVTDTEDGQREIFKGELDLSEGSGKIVITENVGNCEE